MEVNSRWSQRFLAKHNECLRARKTKLLGKTRTWEATREDVDHWLASLRAARVMSHMSAHTVLNYDETCAHADLEGHVCVEAVDKLGANRCTQPRALLHGSFRGRRRYRALGRLHTSSPV